MSHESDLTQLWLKWVESELSQVSKFGIWVESELSQVSKFGIWVESDLSHLDCHESESSQSEKNESSTTLPDSHRGPVFLAGQGALRQPWRAFLSVSTQISWLLWRFWLLPPEFWPLRAFGPRGLNILGGGGGGHTLSPFRHVARIWPRGGGFQGPKVTPTHNYTKSLRFWPTIFWERLN